MALEFFLEWREETKLGWLAELYEGFGWKNLGDGDNGGEDGAIRLLGVDNGVVADILDVVLWRTIENDDNVLLLLDL